MPQQLPLRPTPTLAAGPDLRPKEDVKQEIQLCVAATFTAGSFGLWWQVQSVEQATHQGPIRRGSRMNDTQPWQNA
jgi:hypothetical protein